MIKIKICGLFREEDAAYANEAQPDYAGFVFAESRRKVSPALAARLRGILDSGIVPVGVFVNAPISDIIALYRDGIIDMVQLHGDEDAAYMARLKEASAQEGRGAAPLIKAFSVTAAGTGDLAPAVRALPGGADYYLLDSGSGGTGKSFNWELIGDPRGGLPGSPPWFLAGGIGLHNIKEAMALEPFGIDVSSGAETGGLKDREKMIGLT
ncbi:MAG: phosphoribosylanthranilate isomerase, partial [Treponema sp.]|nr:phosphoribosylanthranilate isomerase [Treponema sp.]